MRPAQIRYLLLTILPPLTALAIFISEATVPASVGRNWLIAVPLTFICILCNKGAFEIDGLLRSVVRIILIVLLTTIFIALGYFYVPDNGSTVWLAACLAFGAVIPILVIALIVVIRKDLQNIH